MPDFSGYIPKTGCASVTRKSRPGFTIDDIRLHNKKVCDIHRSPGNRSYFLGTGREGEPVVYDFIVHVALAWMDGVDTVSCDMNSDFQEALEEKYPYIQPVVDHIHIVKNCNNQVISEVRKAEQGRLFLPAEWKE